MVGLTMGGSVDLRNGYFDAPRTCSGDRAAFEEGLSTKMGPRHGCRMSIVRCFDAEAERLFNAWVDPQFACLWLFQSPASEVSGFDFDLHIGGNWKVSDGKDPAEYVAVGQYLAIEPPRRLVFTMAMPQFSQDYHRVAVEIVPDGLGCVLRLVHDGLAPGSEESIRNGWNAMFDDLSRAVR
jgi:uncharacterized protein YndB with AHSA1/START domain